MRATPVTGVIVLAVYSEPSILQEADRIQFYHRQVTLMLLRGALPGREGVRLLLDHEPQRPGEDEVETALRLLARVIPAYPRAFDVVLADALYAKASIPPVPLVGFSRINTSTSVDSN